MKLASKKTFTQSLAHSFKLLLSYSLGLVAALAWNDAIQSLIRSLFPKESASSIVIKFIYAAVITLLAVIVIFSLAKIENVLARRRTSKKTKKE